MNRKPMLAVDCGALSALRFPLIASPKLDGVRAIIADKVVLSRSLKPIPNRHVQALLKNLPEGLDGELIVGDPTAPDAYRKTVSVVMSEDKPIDGLRLHLFDIQEPGAFSVALGVGRYWHLEQIFLRGLDRTAVTLVPQTEVWNLDELEALEAKTVAAGYEGLILRKPDSPYKHGRSTVKEGFLLKLKRFQDGEAVVIGVTELMHNANEATTNELGRTARSHKRAGLEPTGTMGTLVVRDTKTGVEFEIGTGFTADERRVIWEAWLLYAPESASKFPRLAKYKHFPVGAKDKPRHPVFLGWRDKRDV